ncbi:hypothetical protein IDVR_35360 [Intrasporangium sp. DVR]
MGVSLGWGDAPWRGGDLERRDLDRGPAAAGPPRPTDPGLARGGLASDLLRLPVRLAYALLYLEFCKVLKHWNLPVSRMVWAVVLLMRNAAEAD